MYYSRELESCKQNVKKIYKTRKEVICKSKTFKNEIPKITVKPHMHETFSQRYCMKWDEHP